ncbi:MAG: NUDIX hydrolase YfcD [Thermodesulfobacteriota bacterium]|jgi:8-oxo-dGTP pyrophosphatase MutT (NUDIX family)
MGSSQEEVAIVDRDNRVTGSASRAEMRAQNLIHRATYILVLNRRDELFVQLRTMSKDIYPGHYDVAAGGVVLAGESYEESAARELAEELGVQGVELTPHFDFYHETADNRVWGRIFSCLHEGPFTLQAEEVAGGAFTPLAAIGELAKSHPFTPDGLLVLERFLRER